MMVTAVVTDQQPERRSYVPDLRLTPSAAFFLALLAFSLSALASYLLKHGADQISEFGFSGLTIPDALSLEKSVYLAWEVEWIEIPNISTFIGTVVLYFPMIMWGEYYTVAANSILMSLSAVMFYLTIIRIVDLRNPIRIWVVALILVSTNFYIISCLIYPNKEVPLVFLTSTAIFGFISRRWIITILSLLLCYCFRDGYALIMFIVLSGLFIRRLFFVSGAIIFVALIGLFFCAFPMYYFSSISSALQRNVAISAIIAGDKFSAHGDLVAFAVRMIGNAANLGLRPQMVDVHGGIYLLGAGYWQFGVVLLAGLIWGAKNLCSSSIARGSLALVIVVTLLGVSYGSFVQPRYMMPLMFLLTLGMSESRWGRYVAVPAAVVFPIVFLMLGVLPPLADG